MGALFDHVRRHYAENGEPEWFMLPQPVDVLLSCYSRRATALDTSEPGWQRLWAWRDDSAAIRGHCVVTHNVLAPHRCSLAMGVEAPYRGRGIGRRLMQTALSWVDQQPGLSWVDGQALTHNAPVLALDFSVGFRTYGMLPDVFRARGKAFSQFVLAREVLH